MEMFLVLLVSLFVVAVLIFFFLPIAFELRHALARRIKGVGYFSDREKKAYREWQEEQSAAGVSRYVWGEQMDGLDPVNPEPTDD